MNGDQKHAVMYQTIDQAKKDGYRAISENASIQADIWIMSPHTRIVDQYGNTHAMGSDEDDAWLVFLKKRSELQQPTSRADGD